MIWQLNFILLIFAVLSAVAAISVRDLLSAAVLMGAFSFFMCLLWIEMGSVDVAFTEASVGAGVTTILFIVAVFKTERRSRD